MQIYGSAEILTSESVIYDSATLCAFRRHLVIQTPEWFCWPGINAAFKDICLMFLSAMHVLAGSHIEVLVQTGFTDPQPSSVHFWNMLLQVS